MTHGGKREGAGRKLLPERIKKRPISIKLPGWLVDWMDQQNESRAVLIEQALRRIHKISPHTTKEDSDAE